MGGRGWGGKGGGSSLTFDQLQSMGIGRGEGPGPTLAPPPLYPKMENPPLPLCMDAAMDYMLILKKQFIDFLHDSPAFVQPVAVKNDIERYSDKYKVLSIDGKSNKNSFYRWSVMPRELKPPGEKNKSSNRAVKRKASKQLDVDSKLKKLEELENNDKNDDDDEDDKANSGVVDKNSSDEEEHTSEKEEIEDPDEEMDENTDYVNNYFDNGDGFDDEDDNLDEGPIY